MDTTRSLRILRAPVAFLLLAGSAMLGACGGGGSGEVSGTLAAQRDRWSEQSLTSYRFRFRWNCFCAPEIVQPVEITVRENKVVSIVNVTSGAALDPADFGRYRTIDGLFALLDDAVDRSAARIDMTFDEAMGYPRTAYVDYSVEIADEEIGFQASMLVPIKP